METEDENATDTSRWEGLARRLQDPSSRADAVATLQALVVTKLGPDEVASFDALVPVLVDLWSVAPEHRAQVLMIAKDVARPSSLPLWEQALRVDEADGSRTNALYALEGITAAHASDASGTVIEQLERLLEAPQLDDEPEPGRLRVTCITTLGALGDPSAIPLLVRILRAEFGAQPIAVPRAAVDAVGRIGVADPSAIDAVLAASYRIRDSPTSRNIAERSKAALSALGEAAVPRTLDMLNGRHAEIERLAREAKLGRRDVELAAALMLGGIGSRTAGPDLVKRLPTKDCTEHRRTSKGVAASRLDDDPASKVHDPLFARAVIANSLGMVAEPSAVAPLCACAMSSRSPGDMFPIAEALGRIGGSAATRCLNDIVEQGKYDTDLVTAGLELEIRWQAARFAIHAAGPGDLASVRAAMRSNKNTTVASELEQWGPGLDVLERCRDQRDCYLRVLSDPAAGWFARETSAIQLARGFPGDVEVARAVASAFTVDDPDARVTMAWATRQVLPTQRCPECADALANVLERDRGKLDARYQLSVLVARYVIARLRLPTSAAATSRR